MDETASEVQTSQHTLPMLKIEIEEEEACKNEKESPGNNYMLQYKPQDFTKYVNYYDKNYELELNKVVPTLHSDYCMNSTTAFGVTIKKESIEEEDILDIHERTRNYDAPVTPQQFECKFCDRVFKDYVDLFEHNKEHIKISINTSKDKEVDTLSNCQYSDAYFKNYGYVQPHLSDVHSENIFECELCGKYYKSELNVRRHKRLSHKLNTPPNRVLKDGVKCEYCNVHCKNIDLLYKHMEVCCNGKVDEASKYKCVSCKRLYKTKQTLTLHAKRSHCDYRRILGSRKTVNGVKVQCDYCQQLFKSKRTVLQHILSIHYDYGKTFECSCGKHFRSPRLLRDHERRHTDDNGIHNRRFQCDYCQKFIKCKSNLIRHIKALHYDMNNKTFEYRCREIFGHTNKYQCDQCDKIFKFKRYLTKHIKYVHYDYGRMFECWCGKQFRSPKNLYDHNANQHRENVKNVCGEKFECDTCNKVFKSRPLLSKHVKNVHYDYGKVFECWCGRQFRTPTQLNQHKKRKHGGNIKNINKPNPEVTLPKIVHSEV